MSFEIDFLVHLPSDANPHAEMQVPVTTLESRILALEAELEADGLRAAHLSIIDPDLLKDDAAVEILAATQRRGHLRVSCGIRAGEAKEVLPQALAAELWGVKIHSYLHQIGPTQRTSAIDLGIACAEAGLVPVVCGAYGTSWLEERFGLPIAAGIVRQVSGPVVLAHGGGLQVFDAFLVAEEHPNFVLDFSFSMHYWRGSRLDADFAWVLDRLASGQAVMGSDRPYISWAEASACLDSRLSQSGNQERRTEILVTTPARLLGI